MCQFLVRFGLKFAVNKKVEFLRTRTFNIDEVLKNIFHEFETEDNLGRGASLERICVSTYVLVFSEDAIQNNEDVLIARPNFLALQMYHI